MRDDRRRRRESARAEGTAAEPIDRTGRPERRWSAARSSRSSTRSVSDSPTAIATPVVLCDLEGMTYQEAACRLRCPVGTIGVRLGGPGNDSASG